jgi:PE family
MTGLIELETAIGAANAAAAGPTASLAATAEDEVSAVAATFFSAYGQEYQALSSGWPHSTLLT